MKVKRGQHAHSMTRSMHAFVWPCVAESSTAISWANPGNSASVSYVNQKIHADTFVMILVHFLSYSNSYIRIVNRLLVGLEGGGPQIGLMKSWRQFIETDSL